MNVLITGSNGFIGYHVAKYFKEQGCSVIGLGRKPVASDKTVVDEYIQCDLSKDDVISKCDESNVKFDATVHLAADMRKEPYCVEVISANCCGTQKILEMCEKKEIGVFLQLSSLPVIGKPLFHPIYEDHPSNPYTVYHITKRTEELLANYACNYHGIRTASFRISAPLGTGMNPNTIFPTFVRNAMNNEDIVVMGKGTRRQNYVYVNDIARCLYLSLQEANVKGVYNLTSNLLLSNNELAEMIIQVLGSKSRIDYSGVDSSDSYVWDASICKIEKDLGYKPSGKMEEIITEYSQFLRSSS